jgi:sec-independent protein translocase protein TatA
MKIFDNPVALIVILVIVMMIFGVGKLPEVGKSLGQTIRSFRDGAKDQTPPADPTAQPKAAQPESDALAIAKERFAKGELTKEQYKQLKEELE